MDQYQLDMTETPSRLPCYVFCICLLTNKYQKYKSVELGDQLRDTLTTRV